MGAQCAPISLPIRSVRFHTATHTISSLQARHKVNCPKGKRRCPGGRPRRTICQPSASCLTVVAQETTGLPYDIICANYLHSLSPCVHFPFSIFNSPFCTHKKRGKHTLSSCSLQLIVPSRGDDCIQRSACGTVWAGFAAHKVLIMREIRAGEQADDLFAT